MEEIKFLDLTAQYPKIKSEILEKFEDIIENSRFVSSKYVEEFETSFATFTNTDNCIAVNNGTSALHMILFGLGIGPGDEVILPANTFFATAEAVSLVNATPVFVDAKNDTYNIDPTLIEEKITAKTKAIIPVHLYGQPANMDPILEIAQKHSLYVIEDACQAHGATYKGKSAGSIGTAAAFSMYPGKNLGAWGEGGAITTNDTDLAKKLKLIRDHGSPEKYVHEVIGGNFRMNEFQGAVLTTKIQYLAEWNTARKKHAKQYLELLSDAPNIVLPQVADGIEPVWHLFVIQTKKRDELIAHLNDNNIQTGIHYPTPLHLTNAYKHLGYSKGDFPVVERVQSQIISLPMYAELSATNIESVGAEILNFDK